MLSEFAISWDSVSLSLIENKQSFLQFSMVVEIFKGNSLQKNKREPVSCLGAL